MNDTPTELEELLRDGLDRLTCGARLREGVAPLIRRRAHRVQRARYAAGAGAAAVITAAALTVTAGGTSSPQPTQGEAYVISHVTSALTAPAYAHDVLHTVSIGPVGWHSQTWSDQDAARVQQQGMDLGSHRSGRQYVDEFVGYRSKTWWQFSTSDSQFVQMLSAISELEPVQSLSGCSHQQGSPSANTNWRFYIRDLLSCGAFKVTGHAHVDGTAVLVLTASTRLTKSTVLATRPGEPHHALSETLLVNATSYLPVRLSWNEATGAHQVLASTDFHWLRPTVTNLASLTITIPPGFHRVSHP